MESRREFLKKSIFASGGVGIIDFFPEILQKALAIDPAPGSTYLDAEHIVILMQENRSFDHCFGALKGVRGLSDPRGITLPNGNSVFLQANKTGQTYGPFRLNLKGSKSTWMGDLPHSRSSQIDAFNEGKYDNWLESKRSRHPEGKDMPLTMGFYTREDLPFHYALADAFTICDQHFCSSITSTTPNRSYLWTGNIVSMEDGIPKMNIRNDNFKPGSRQWETMPEVLSKHGFSWKFYQNDLSSGGGYQAQERSWLSNFGCNPLEYFEKFQVKFSKRYVNSLQNQLQTLPSEIEELTKKLDTLPPGDVGREKINRDITIKSQVLQTAREEYERYNASSFARLSKEEKELFERAFVTNAADPDFGLLTSLTVDDQGQKRTLNVPKGDLFYQFRKDVSENRLPAVSWLASPQNFSDHPSAPWYGAWYVSQVIEILTQNPDVWKKTIFLLTYDENDGYYDHVVPFVAPDPRRPETGKTSAGIDTELEWVRRENEIKQGVPEKEAREGPIGLGFRVPLIIASPWSRGGYVCSEVFDHTSVLQFLEKWGSARKKTEIKLKGIGSWRRLVAGNLASAFRPFDKNEKKLPFLDRDRVVGDIYNAQFKEAPSGFKAFSPNEQTEISKDLRKAPWYSGVEKGVRPAAAIPYEFYVDGNLSKDGKSFEIRFEASNRLFGKDAGGGPFIVYAGDSYRTGNEMKTGRNWHFAVQAGDTLTEKWPLDDFPGKQYYLKLFGPNGYYREFKGSAGGTSPEFRCQQEYTGGANSKASGNLTFLIKNIPGSGTVEITDNAYGTGMRAVAFKPGGTVNETFILQKSHGWYDFTVRLKGQSDLEYRYAGHIETGKNSYSDPLMGGVV